MERSEDEINGGQFEAMNSIDSPKVLESILNGMDAYLYVSDAATDELLFINDKMRRHFHFQNSGIGEICWKVLQQGFTQRCEGCPILKLKESPDSVVVWEEHNTVTKRYYRNSDRFIRWSDGRLAHMQHSIDITDAKIAEQALKMRLEQQELMSRVSQCFISDEEIEKSIRKALKMTGEFAGIERILLAIYDKEKRVLRSTYEWFNGSLKRRTERAAVLEFGPNNVFYQEFIENKKEYISLDILEGKKYQLAQSAGIKSLLAVPLFIKNEFAGMLEFSYCTSHYCWTDSDMHLANLLSGVLSGALGRQQMERGLIDAKEAAESANMAKSEFLARMSHEIRTPMNAIIGMTSVAGNSDDPARKDYCLGKIESASNHLLGVINDILDMSKIEANKFEIFCEEFDFEKMLINVTNMINFRVDEKNHNLVVHLAQDVPLYLNSDEQRLSQVITNLLSNAVKFTPEHGTINLYIDKISEEDDDVTLLFKVQDNGIGISKDQQSRLFQSFEQADGGRARKYEGTGLGLAISKRIVELMNGEIWIESELDQGTVFSFTIQAQKGRRQPKPAVHSKINKENLRILAVDDSLETRTYFSSLMETLKLPCDVAASGTEALKKIQAASDHPYNIFFVDWMMPGMDGIELTREIKRVSSEESVVIMISAARWSDIAQEAVQAGASRFISKPLFPSALVDCINECLGAGDMNKPDKTADKQQETGQFNGRTVLLVEDIEINREIVMALLEETGINIVCAENGKEAVRLFAADPTHYELILMDIHMPVMDGYEATEKIRALGHETVRQVPIVAMTANAFKEDIDRCISYGMNDHMAKPIHDETLIEILKKYLI